MLARRAHRRAEHLATLFLSQGVPMLEMGDELWRTQRGNNNPYCHDSELTWVDWSSSPERAGDARVRARARGAARERHRLFRRHDFLGRPGAAAKDITWLRARRRGDDRAGLAGARARRVAFRLTVPPSSPDPATASDDSFLVLMNGEAGAD